MAADYSRIHRLLKILSLVQGGIGWTPARLAQECRVKERTIYRDLKMLEGAGIPFFFDREKKSYCVQRDFFMPGVQLTLDETLALAALAERIGGGDQVPYTQAAVKAIAKIRGQLPVSIRTELEKLEPNVSIHLAASMPPEAAADVYGRVRDALANRTALRCEYESVTSTPANNRADNRDGKTAARNQKFLFKPYALFFGQRAWYAVGFHGGRDEIRSLKLNRFTSVEPTDHPFEIPQSFSLQKHLGNAWRMIRGNRRYEVELTFDAQFAETVAETHWHATQEVDWQDGGSIVFRCTVDGLDEIVWWVLSMGPHCIVKKPADLADRVRDLAAGIVANYAAAAPPISKAKSRAEASAK